MFIPIEKSDGGEIPYESAEAAEGVSKRKGKAKSKVLLLSIEKRDGRTVPYDISKIADAIEKAIKATGRGDAQAAGALAEEVETRLIERYTEATPGIEDIQDIVEEVLMDKGFPLVARNYGDYRKERTRERERRMGLMVKMNELDKEPAVNSDLKRANANIDGDTPMGKMLQFGCEAAKN